MLEELDMKIGDEADDKMPATELVTKLTGSCRTSTGPYLCC
jgi:hypothetical protein